MRRLGIAFVVAVLIPTSAFAQGRRGGGRTRGGSAGAVVWDKQSTIYLFDALLSLTSVQEKQVTTVFDAAGKAAQPLATALGTGSKALFEAAKSGQHDDEIERLAAEQGQLTTQLQALQARTFAKMWALLTADQQAKVDDSIYSQIGVFLANTAQYGG